MSVSVLKFGTYQNQPIHLISLKNQNGVAVEITNYGATITTLKVPNSQGEIENIVCGFETLEGYFKKEYTENAPYFGGIVGRYCSQIKDAKFSLNGTEYELAKNCGPNNLHGGTLGFDKRVWDFEVFEKKCKVTLTLQSNHLEEGFPGNVKISVTYSLTDDNSLKIEYHAIPDHDTPLSLTNHTYFNLNGFKSNVENHMVSVNADKKQVWDETGAATGEIASVKGQPDDLRKTKNIGTVHQELNDGFEHFYIFNDQNFTLQEVSKIHCPTSGRTLTVSTTEPGMLLYTGKYTSDQIQRENGQQFGKYKGLCCETHRYPNGPNLENSPKSITKANEVFESTTVFKFEW